MAGLTDLTGGLSMLDGVISVNGESGAITLTSTGNTVVITKPTSNTINLESSGGGSGSPGGIQYDVQLNNGSGGFAGSNDLNFQGGYLTINGDSGYGQLQFLNSPASAGYGGAGINGTATPIIVGALNGDLSIWSSQAMNFSADTGSTKMAELDIDGRFNIPSIEGYTLATTTPFLATTAMSTIYVNTNTLNSQVQFPQASTCKGKIIRVVNGDGSGSTSINFVSLFGDAFSGDFQSLSTQPWQGAAFMSDGVDRWNPAPNSVSSLYVGNLIFNADPAAVLFADAVGNLTTDNALSYDLVTFTAPRISVQDGDITNPAFQFGTASTGFYRPGDDSIIVAVATSQTTHFEGLTTTFWPVGNPLAIGNDGSISLSGDPGSSGFVLISQGPAAQPIWGPVTNPFDQSLNIADSVTFAAIVSSTTLTAASTGFQVDSAANVYATTLNIGSGFNAFTVDGGGAVVGTSFAGDGSMVTGVTATNATNAINANYLYDTAGTPKLAADGVNRQLLDSSGTTISLDWETRSGSDITNIASFNWDDRSLFDVTGAISIIDWHTDTTNINSAAYWFDSANGNRITGDGSGLTGISSGVTSVSGTTNRITSTGGTTPVIDIDSGYVGQSSLITTGTLTSGATGTGFTVALGTSTITGILGSANGGTANGFTKFSGAASTEKTFTLPNASAVILTDNSVVTGAQGGTGVANTGKTITLGGNLTTSGVFASIFTMTNTTNVTFPTSGTLATVAGTVASITGTANQVIASASTGAVTLSTPQDIATTSSPQFGTLGLGAAASASARLNIVAGSTTVAPILLASGTSLTSALAGALEFTTDDYFATITTGAARKRLIMADPVGGLTSGRVPFVTTNGRLTDSTGVTWSGSEFIISGSSSVDIYVGDNTYAAVGSGTGKAFSFYSNNTGAQKFYMLTTGDIGMGTTSPTASLHITQAVKTTGSPSVFKITGALNTTLTASTESIDIDYNLARSVQFATGALTTQRAILTRAPTYAFVAASTITTAVTDEISGAPIAGTNATITTGIAQRINTGYAAAKGLVVKGATSQTGNLQDWQDSTGAILSFVAANGDLSVPDEVYGSGWNGSVEVPTKNAVYDKIEAITTANAGNYTPTATNVTNITSSTSNNATWSQVGNVVTVYGSITITNTLAVTSEVDVSLPVASNLGATTDLNGTGQSDVTLATNVIVKGDATNDRASLFFTAVGVGGTGTVFYSFQYRVI